MDPHIIFVQLRYLDTYLSKGNFSQSWKWEQHFQLLQYFKM